MRKAIAEAALRPTMRFVAVKSAARQARAVAVRTHRCLVRQRTQSIDALRGHLAAFGLVAPKGPASLKLPENALDDETTDLPDPVREMGTVYLERIANLAEVIERRADELEVRRDQGSIRWIDPPDARRRPMRNCAGCARSPGPVR